ncbi:MULTISPECIES: VOC family protein [unclassified Nocardia]|uniref:VOC family protein n=1 Tax=unclassified Nocardia TaxID=2637762 RepID=UPI002E230EF3|nr:VOC family protein [Nocardia sp. NBC_01009]
MPVSVASAWFDGGMEIRGIDNVLVPVGDLGAAVEFYEGALGMAVKFTLPQDGIAVFDVGGEVAGVMVRVDPSAGAQGLSGMRLWLEVPDALAAAAELEGYGVPVLGAPYEVGTGWSVEVADPWGNVIGLTDYVKRPELARPES